MQNILHKGCINNKAFLNFPPIFTRIKKRAWNWVIFKYSNFLQTCQQLFKTFSLLMRSRWWIKKITHFLLPPSELIFPCTRKSDPRSAFKRIDTFCRILWHNDLTSSSLQISLTYWNRKEKKRGNWKDWHHQEAIWQLTNSNISSFSSKCLNSLLDSLCVRLIILFVVPFWFCTKPNCVWWWWWWWWWLWWWLCRSCCEFMLRKVGVPSIVFTMGFNKPPRSNSWAEIFLLWIIIRKARVIFLLTLVYTYVNNLYAKGIL